MSFGSSLKRAKNKFNESKQNVVNRQNVANGEGYMQGNQYVAYTSADKEHIQGAEANKNATYPDTATNSALGTYNAEGITAKTQKKKLKSVLGGGSILGG